MIEHKQDVIKGLTDDIPLANQRQLLNDVIRKGCSSGYQWLSSKITLD